MIAHEINVPGHPTAKGRPRATRTGQMYTPAKTKAAERDFLSLAASQLPAKPFEGPLALDVHFMFPMPNSWSVRKRARMEGTGHTVRPDLDNLVKLVLDALNGRAWLDDRQVYRIHADKINGYAPLTRVVIWRQEEQP